MGESNLDDDMTPDGFARRFDAGEPVNATVPTTLATAATAGVDGEVLQINRRFALRAIVMPAQTTSVAHLITA